MSDIEYVLSIFYNEKFNTDIDIIIIILFLKWNVQHIRYNKKDIK